MSATYQNDPPGVEAYQLLSKRHWNESDLENMLTTIKQIADPFGWPVSLSDAETIIQIRRKANATIKLMVAKCTCLKTGWYRCPLHGMKGTMR